MISARRMGYSDANAPAAVASWRRSLRTGLAATIAGSPSSLRPTAARVVSNRCDVNY